MSGYRLPQSQYAHQKNVKSFEDLMFTLKEHHLIQISRLNTCCLEYKPVFYKVHQYLHVDLLPFEEFSENCLYSGEALTSSTEITSILGIMLIWLLLKKVKRLSLGIRQGKKQFFR